jgi:hypothetical protein
MPSRASLLELVYEGTLLVLVIRWPASFSLSKTTNNLHKTGMTNNTVATELMIQKLSDTPVGEGPEASPPVR